MYKISWVDYVVTKDGRKCLVVTYEDKLGIKNVLWIPIAYVTRALSKMNDNNSITNEIEV